MKKIPEQKSQKIVATVAIAFVVALISLTIYVSNKNKLATTLMDDQNGGGGFDMTSGSGGDLNSQTGGDDLMSGGGATLGGSDFSGPETTDLMVVADATCVPELTLQNEEHVKIKWKGDCLDTTDAVFEQEITYEKGSVTVDVENLNTTINSPAEIILYDLPYEKTPVVYIDGELCGESDCKNISYENGDLKFDVEHFTTYTAGENSELTIYDSIDLGTATHGNPIDFFAEYKDIATGEAIDSASCKVSFDGMTTAEEYDMAYDAGEGFYKYSTTLPNDFPSTSTWNVICSSDNFETLEAGDELDIPQAPAGLIPDSERQALIDFYNSTGGDNWTNRSNWLEPPGTECDWYGVTCNDEGTHVIRLATITNDLVGEIPPSLGDLTELISLSIDDSLGLTGPIPQEIFDIKTLKFFDVSDNSLSGEIPNISSATSLETFWIDENKLTSYNGTSFPVSIESFIVSNNSLDNDSIDKIIAQIREVEEQRGGGGELALEGDSMGIPSDQGIENINYLLDHGWNVTYNGQECTDSDGGESFYEKGTVRGRDVEPHPFIWSSWTDYCGTSSNENGKLVEYVCDENDQVKKVLHECFDGCEDGVCLGNPPASCTDSDGGKNVLVDGEVWIADQDGNPMIGQGDVCDYSNGDNVIMESFCKSDSEGDRESITCPDEAPYCNKGACSTEKPQCIEDDGGNNIFVAGTTFPSRIADHTGSTDYCRETSSNNFLDECEGDNCSIREFYCVYDYPDEKFIDVECPGGCVNGACVGGDQSSCNVAVENGPDSQGTDVYEDYDAVYDVVSSIGCINDNINASLGGVNVSPENEERIITWSCGNDECKSSWADPNLTRCDQCGEGFLNVCDHYECVSFSEGCYYDTSGINSCESCESATCESYPNETICNNNDCELSNCVWDGDGCITQVGECVGEGESFDWSDFQYPDECCEGLTKWDSGLDTRISIADECYGTNQVSGAPISTCINCGNGICEEKENPCNCLEDCAGEGKSRYQTVEEFCDPDSGSFDYYCVSNTGELNQDLELCNICDGVACFDSSDCVESEYCSKDSCFDNLGLCVAKPDACPISLYEPICGCDNETYDNECTMKMTGRENKKSDGECFDCIEEGEISDGSKDCCDGLTVQSEEICPDNGDPCYTEKFCVKCSMEGELASGYSMDPVFCCDGLEEFDMVPELADDPNICYDSSKGDPECDASGTRSEGWYYPDGSLLRYDNCSSQTDCTELECANPPEGCSWSMGVDDNGCAICGELECDGASCDQCGGGIWDLDICTEDECLAISEGCYFDTSGINSCESCESATCEAYSNEDTCNSDDCGLNNCVWENDGCTSFCPTIMPDECPDGFTCSCEPVYDNQNICIIGYDCESTECAQEGQNLSDTQEPPHECCEGLIPVNEGDESPVCRKDQIYCTQETKTCDDGTFVSRNPDLGCEFDPCPTDGGCPEDAKVCPDGTVLSRNPDLNCEFDPCPHIINCPTVYQPVCGSDGNTYPNECQAGVAGITDFTEGECDTIVCAQDTKTCEDGLVVSRNPDLGCEFDPCPTDGGCPEDAKVCPDGTVLSRNPDLNCEFDPCPDPVTCDQCGGGIWDLDICTEDECLAISEGCYYDTSGINSCESCESATCEAYSNEDTCNSDDCGLNNCVWDGDGCVVDPSICVEDWDCTEYGECGIWKCDGTEECSNLENATRRKVCTDLNNCGTENDKPVTEISCTLTVSPVAAFNANPISGDSPLTVEFTFVSTGDNLQYYWDFDGDGNVDSTEENPSHTYGEVGIYSVTLVVTNEDGSDTKTEEGLITVTEGEDDGAPVANFYMGSFLEDGDDVTVQFISTSTGENLTYEWDFDGDGEIDSTEEDPEHTYTSSGTYDVTLTVFNEDGNDYEIKVGYITIEEGEDIIITIDDEDEDEDEDDEDGSIGNYIWNDEDGDGDQDSDEEGIEDVDVKLTWAGEDDEFGTSDDRTWETETNSDGKYEFDDLPEGKFRVEVDEDDIDDDWDQTYDPDGDENGETVITLGANDKYTKADFGYEGEKEKVAPKTGPGTNIAILILISLVITGGVVWYIWKRDLKTK